MLILIVLVVLYYHGIRKLLLEHKVLYKLLQKFLHQLVMQFESQVNMRFISQLISGNSRAFEKLLKYFNGTAISTSFVLSALGVLPVILALNLND